MLRQSAPSTAIPRGVLIDLLIMTSMEGTGRRPARKFRSGGSPAVLLPFSISRIPPHSSRRAAKVPFSCWSSVPEPFSIPRRHPSVHWFVDEYLTGLPLPPNGGCLWSVTCDFLYPCPELMPTAAPHSRRSGWVNVCTRETCPEVGAVGSRLPLCLSECLL